MRRSSGAAAGAADVEAVVLRSPGALQAVAPEWDALAASCPRHSAAQTFLWAWAGWITRAPNDGLCCVTLRQGARLVCVWPFLAAASPALRTLKPLGSGIDEEYGGPLLATDLEPGRLVAVAWAALRREADVVLIYNVEAGSPVDVELQRSSPGCCRQPSATSFISFEGYATWKDFTSSRPRKLISDLRRQNKRLAGLGQLAFGPIDDPDAIASGVKWMVAQKREWLRANRLESPWLYEAQAEAFLIRAATDAVRPQDPRLGATRLFLLTLDGRNIAAGYILVNPCSFEFYITVYDPALENYSPGKVLIERLVRWSFERGLPFDFRMAPAAYKERWANRSAWVASFTIAATARGLPRVAAAHVEASVQVARRAAGSLIRRTIGRSPREFLSKRRSTH